MPSLHSSCTRPSVTTEHPVPSSSIPYSPSVAQVAHGSGQKRTIDMRCAVEIHDVGSASALSKRCRSFNPITSNKNALAFHGCEPTLHAININVSHDSGTSTPRGKNVP